MQQNSDLCASQRGSLCALVIRSPVVLFTYFAYYSKECSQFVATQLDYISSSVTGFNYNSNIM